MQQMDAFREVQDVEFQAQSAIAVREEYKAKLRQVLDSLVPPDRRSGRSPQVEHLSTSRHRRSDDRTTNAPERRGRDAIAERLRTRATLPHGKEMQVLGDWLLLLREASVTVVTSIQRWRQVVHQGRPVPYEWEHQNYLLVMCDDVDFLDQYSFLVEWLGFPLKRNPFIVRGGIDNSDGSQQSLGAMSSLPRVQRLKGDATGAPSSRKSHAPPLTLVRPLISILPPDDVIECSGVRDAQAVLLEEEALRGQTRLLERSQLFLERSSHLSESGKTSTEVEEESERTTKTSTTVYDQIASTTTILRRAEIRLAFCERELHSAADIEQQLRKQAELITRHRENDRADDHHAWHYREKCRRETSKTVANLSSAIQGRWGALQTAVATWRSRIYKLRHTLSSLEIEKKEARQARQNINHHNESHRQSQQRQRTKTLARNLSMTTKKTQRVSVAGEGTTRQNNNVNATEMVYSVDLNESKAADEVLQSLLGMRDAHSLQGIEERRFLNIQQREERRIERENDLRVMKRELEHKRMERAMMYLEDQRSAFLERQHRDRIDRQVRQNRLKMVTRVPIFSCVQQLGNDVKRFRLTVYDQRAKGYVSDGLRVVAYDPESSSTFELLMSTREYRSLGYGRTHVGLASFCQWLCLIYERRSRKFRLVWSGAPCPPPLRIREYDHALVCIHKEGLCIRSSNNPSSYRLCSIFVRLNDNRRVYLSTASMPTPITHDDVRGCTRDEYVLSPASLLPVASLVTRTDTDGNVYLVWLHHASVDQTQTFPSSNDAQSMGSDLAGSDSRVYSGEINLEGNVQALTRVDLFDVSPTEYNLVLSYPTLESPLQSTVLLKRDVNPYAIRLPHSAYGDLLECVRIENLVGPDGTVLFTPSVQPAWRDRLAKYIRTVRMARFGVKVCKTFYLVTLTLVQQKTEFRGHLLFELTAQADLPRRQTIRISLTEFLRCPDAFRGDTSDDCCREWSECPTCTDRRIALEQLDGPSVQPVLDEHELCEACVATLKSRAEAVKQLIYTHTVEGSLYQQLQGVCPLCFSLQDPLIVVIPEGNDYEEIAESLASCFHVHTLDESEADAVRDTLTQYHACVIRTPMGTTTSSAATLLHDLQWTLFPQKNRLPAQVILLARHISVRGGVNHVSHERGTEVMVSQSVQDLTSCIDHIGRLDPVGGSGHLSDILNFESYLVSEALMMESVQIVLGHPEAPWRVPGETVGASSWPIACQYLMNPQLFAWNLHRCTDLALDNSTRELLNAYRGHPRWPHQHDDVRPAFHALWSFMAHFIHSLEVLDHYGGLLCAMNNDQVDIETTTLRLPNNVSVVVLPDKAEFYKADCFELHEDHGLYGQESDRTVLSLYEEGQSIY